MRICMGGRESDRSCIYSAALAKEVKVARGREEEERELSLARSRAYCFSACVSHSRVRADRLSYRLLEICIFVGHAFSALTSSPPALGEIVRVYIYIHTYAPSNGSSSVSL